MLVLFQKKIMPAFIKILIGIDFQKNYGPKLMVVLYLILLLVVCLINQDLIIHNLCALYCPV